MVLQNHVDIFCFADQDGKEVKMLNLVMKGSVKSSKGFSMIIHNILEKAGDKVLKLHSAFYPSKLWKQKLLMLEVYGVK